jgi:hypothetical protein
MPKCAWHKIIGAESFEERAIKVQRFFIMANLRIARERIDQAEKVLAELKAIEVWDQDYWTSVRPDRNMTESFMARCLRKTEILTELSTLIDTLEKHHSEVCRAWCPDSDICPRHQTFEPLRNSRLFH